MPGEYATYLDSYKFYPSFQAVSYLGTSNRTAGAIMLGGRSGCAGSASRIYSYLSNAKQLDFATANFRKILKANAYKRNDGYRNHTMGW